ncbi:helix-turn-helix transcriptional regulator [Vibrio sp. JPW-9-11-11]|nr:helix-turn-helix transcriptional regulator [Vibrio sp. JPW-9-11-11]
MVEPRDSLVTAIANSELGWQNVALDMVKQFDLHVCHIMVVNRKTLTIRYHIDEGEKLPDDLAREYLKVIQNDQIMMQILSYPPVDCFYAVSQLSEDEYRYYINSEFYKTWSKPQGLVDSATLCLNEDGDWLTLMMCNRNSSVGDFTQTDLNQMNAMIPQLKRAALHTFSHQADHLLSSRFTSLLETFRIPVAILTERGQLCAMNQAMQSLICDKNEIKIINNCLTLDHREKNQMLYSNLIQASKRLDTYQDYTLVEHDNIDLNNKLTIGVQPLETCLSCGQQYLNGVMIYAISPKIISPAPIDKLMILFGLTEKEAIVCQKVAMGHPVKRIALDENISVNTVKFHVKQIFQKTGCNDKVSLASLVNVIPNGAGVTSKKTVKFR